MRWNSLALTVVFVGVIGLFHYWRAGLLNPSMPTEKLLKIVYL
jgi:hypothetical protein